MENRKRTTELFVEQFWDTEDNLLMKNNYWLKLVNNDKWNLKVGANTLNGEILYAPFDDYHQVLINARKQLAGHKQTPHCYSHFETTFFIYVNFKRMAGIYHAQNIPLYSLL
jgi:hypothetical protein